MDKWIVKKRGGPNRTGWEISVIRSSNKHGKRSYGWFDKNKILISHDGGPCHIEVIKIVWNGLVELAEKIAKRLNEMENQNKLF